CRLHCLPSSLGSRSRGTRLPLSSSFPHQLLSRAEGCSPCCLHGKMLRHSDWPNAIQETRGRGGDYVHFASSDPASKAKLLPWLLKSSDAPCSPCMEGYNGEREGSGCFQGDMAAWKHRRAKGARSLSDALVHCFSMHALTNHDHKCRRMLCPCLLEEVGTKNQSSGLFSHRHVFLFFKLIHLSNLRHTKSDQHRG
uniref:Uncharacterized protein n=1 Tax=Falco tinnunculus TaxID=100819 RepID=A0A8C4V5A4_FALTI